MRRLARRRIRASSTAYRSSLGFVPKSEVRAVKNEYRASGAKITKQNVFIRDAFMCWYCGAGGWRTKNLTIDHLIPVARGGTNAQDNLVTACKRCNRLKSDKMPDDQAFLKYVASCRRTERYRRYRTMLWLYCLLCVRPAFVAVMSGRSAVRLTLLSARLTLLPLSSK